MNEQWHKEIDTYFRNQMTEEEARLFEIKREEDQAFNLAVEQYLEDRANIALSLKASLKEQVKQLYEESKEVSDNPSKVIKLPWRRYSIAASLFVILGIGLWWMSQNTAKDASSLYASYYENPIISNARSVEEAKVNWESIVSMYSNSRNQELIPLLEAYIENGEGSIAEAKVYLGICFLELSEINSAIQTFSSVNPNSSYFPSAQWYLALSHLKNSEVEKAKTELAKIVQKGGYKSVEAADILKNLE